MFRHILYAATTLTNRNWQWTRNSRSDASWHR